MSDVIVMEIEVKGPMEPYKILLEPYAVVIPGEVFIFTTIRRQFKVKYSCFFPYIFTGIVISFTLFCVRFSCFCLCQMWNHSRTFITFQWEEKNSGCHTIGVEPSSGRIGVGRQINTPSTRFSWIFT